MRAEHDEVLAHSASQSREILSLRQHIQGREVSYSKPYRVLLTYALHLACIPCIYVKVTPYSTYIPCANLMDTNYSLKTLPFLLYIINTCGHYSVHIHCGVFHYYCLVQVWMINVRLVWSKGSTFNIEHSLHVL